MSVTTVDEELVTEQREAAATPHPTQTPSLPTQPTPPHPTPLHSIPCVQLAVIQVSIDVDCASLFSEDQLLTAVAAVNGLPVSAFSLSEETIQTLLSVQSQCDREGALTTYHMFILRITYCIRPCTSFCGV